MARVLITGSSDGLGLMAGELLAGEGHEVTLHARNEARAGDARVALPAAAHLVVGDLASIRGMREVAEQANKLGRYDAVIHNAGVGYREPRRIQTPDGLSHVFAINVLAPYLLTALMTRPDRLVYLSSGMTGAGTWTWPTCRGSAGPGTDRRPIRTPSCSTWCSRSRWPATGRTCSATPWSRAGWRPRWVARARRTTCPRPR